MKSAKTIASHIAELEKMEARLEEYEKVLAKLFQIMYGFRPKEIENLVRITDENNAFSVVKKYFGLATVSDIKSFAEIFCNESSLRFFQARLSGGLPKKEKTCKTNPE